MSQSGSTLTIAFMRWQQALLSANSVIADDFRHLPDSLYLVGDVFRSRRPHQNPSYSAAVRISQMPRS